MALIEPASAVIVRVPVPPGIERLRTRWDRAASLGVPAHVTVLFPDRSSTSHARLPNSQEQQASKAAGPAVIQV